jgi:hypothetical protein
MPSLAKIWRAHILPSRLFTLIRVRLGSNTSNISSYHGLAEHEKTSRRKKGPYSIPTTRDFGTANLSKNDDLEFLAMPEGYEKPITAVKPAQQQEPGLVEVEAGRIQKDISWDQQSHTKSDCVY